MPGPTRLIRTAIGLPLGVARRAAGLALRALPGIGDEREPHPRQEPPTAAAPAPEPAADVVEAAEWALDRDRERVEESAAIVDEPPPAETEQEVVAESADVEATEPPGPELHVDEPWEGYRRMRASEITARLEGQPPEVLAAVELYESAHRKRPAVLNAVRAIRA